MQVLITLNDLERIKCKANDNYVQSINDTLIKYQIGLNKDVKLAKLEVLHFMTQILTETGGLNYFEEFASGEAYENRKDLGNVNKGDGKLFKGRGAIQLTGRDVYFKYIGNILNDSIDNVHFLSKPPYCFDSAGWFLTVYKPKNKFFDLSHSDDLKNIRKMVNGGFNGMESNLKNGFIGCKEWYNRCKSALGII